MRLPAGEPGTTVYVFTAPQTEPFAHAEVTGYSELEARCGLNPHGGDETSPAGGREIVGRPEPRLNAEVSSVLPAASLRP